MARARLGAALVTASALVATSGCEKKPNQGFLRVKAPSEGAYEIYRIANETPLQFISEQSGRFNEDIALTPGSYLVLADCSSETVIVHPHAHESLVAHRLEFKTPHPPGPKDGFSIQCSRSEKTKSRQNFTNRYELNVLSGKRDLLVGMVPLHVDLDDAANSPAPNQQVLTYTLSALQVADFAGDKQELSYFVSPVNELIAATKYEQFGHWEFLLPGRYAVEVNGTSMQVDLKAGEERVVKPALLKVTTPAGIDLDEPARIKGSPWLVEINNEHWLNFNDTYPVLPGKATVSISGSSQTVDIELKEGEYRELETRSVEVKSGCPQSDLSCLGNHGVSLYEPDQPYPFLESVSDIPLLYIDEDTPILVGIDGSRDILYAIPATVHEKTLELGYAQLQPQPQRHPGQITDLVRVSTVSPGFSGHSLDINLEHPTLMPLIAGAYHLDQFSTISTVDKGSRSSAPRAFTIEPGKTTDLSFVTFLSEKRFSQLKKKRSPEPASGESPESEIGRSTEPVKSSNL